MSRKGPHPKSSRRRFLRHTALLAAAGVATPLAAEAPGLMVSWRDAWLWRRLAGRRPRLAPAVSLRPSAEGVTIARGEGEWLLNVTAALVLSLCDGERTVAQVAQETAGALCLGLAEVQGDVARTVRDLLRMGCVLV